MYTNLRDERIFPTFPLCPDEDDISLDFYTPIDYILNNADFPLRAGLRKLHFGGLE